jgi:hypothetical protein
MIAVISERVLRERGDMDPHEFEPVFDATGSSSRIGRGGTPGGGRERDATMAGGGGLTGVGGGDDWR